MPQRRVLKADALLLIAAAIWGTGFVAQRLGMEHVGPMTFNGLRFGIGTILLVPLVWRRAVRTAPAGEARPAPTWTVARLVRSGLPLGAVLFVGASLQQIGMIGTTAGRGGFITGLYVIFVPLIGTCVGHRIPRRVWLAVALALGGLYLLSVTETFDVAWGDWFVLACAVAWALHVLLIGRFAPRIDPVALAAFQFCLCAVLSLIAAGIWETPRAEAIHAARWAILYGGVFPVAIAFTLQVVAQQSAPPTHAAILLSLEAVFAALAGWLILSEQLTERQFLGCALMLAGMLVSQIRLGRDASKTPAG